MAAAKKQEAAPAEPKASGGEPSGVRMQSPTGHFTTVPHDIVEALLASGYVKAK